jgi:hypothetical protein
VLSNFLRRQHRPGAICGDRGQTDPIVSAIALQVCG